MTDEDRLHALKVTRVEQCASGVVVVAENQMINASRLINGVAVSQRGAGPINVRRIEYIVDAANQPRVGQSIGVML